MEKISYVFVLLVFVMFAGGCTQSDSANVQKDLAKDTQNTIADINQKQGTIIYVVQVYEEDNKLNVVVKNGGRETIKGSEMKTYVDSQPVNTNGCDGNLDVGTVCTLKLDGVSFPEIGKEITITVVPISGGREEKYICVGTNKNVC